MADFNIDDFLQTYPSPTGPAQSTGGVTIGWAEPKEKEYEMKPWERIKKSTDETIGSLFGAGSALADAMGFDKAKVYAADEARAWFEKAADRDLVNTDFKEIDSPLDAAKWGYELFVEYLPDLALMALGGAGAATATAKAGSTLVGKKVVKGMFKEGFQKNYREVVKDLGTGAGRDAVYKETIKRTMGNSAALLGASSVEGLQSQGTFFLDDLENRGDEADPYRAMAVGLGTTAIAMLSPITRGVASGVAGKEIKGGIAKTAVGEFFEESGQEAWTMAHEAGIDPNVTFEEMIKSPEGQMRLWESGVAGLVLGTSFGVAAKPFQKKDAKPEDETAGPKTKVDVTEEITQTPEKVLESVDIDTTGDTKSPAGTTPETKPLDRVRLKETVLTEKGETAEVERRADVVLKNLDTKIDKYYEVLACIS